jgi:hypothetical protein
MSENVVFLSRVQFIYFDQSKWYDICLDTEENLWFAWGKEGNEGRYKEADISRSREHIKKKIDELVADHSYYIAQINHQEYEQTGVNKNELIEIAIRELMKNKPSIHESRGVNLNELNLKPGILCPIW